MSFNTFCNICFTKDCIIKLCGEENEPILNILISFTSCPDIVNGIIYLCINCCNKLEEYDNFRELCLTNFVRFRYLYNEHKKQLEIRNAPDIEIQLKAFVDVNVERPSGTPLIENYEAAQALRNDTSNVDDIYKKESDSEVTKIDLDDLLNQNDLSHAENITLENDIQIYHEKYRNNSSNEIQKNNTIIVLRNDELNPDRSEKSQDQLVSDTVVDASACHESADDDNSDVSFNPEECVTDDSTVEEGSNVSENKTKTSDGVCNVCHDSLPCDKCHTTYTDTATIHKRFHSGERPYKCDECSLEFKYRCHLKTHKRKHTAEKPYQCDECGVGFTQRSNLRTHKLIHTGERPYKCDECGAKFSFRDKLKSHKRIHTGEKPYKCDVCGSSFVERSKLNRHKRVHTGEKPYKCDECGVAFSHRFHLNRHKLLHTGEKPYKCDECDLRFAFMNYLNRHKRRHKSKLTDEKPYKCDECGVAFSVRSNLYRHKLIHTRDKPYKCDECSAKFSDRSYLKVHKRIHSGDKPYKCDECSLRFTRGHALNRHKRVHTGERPYKCDECGAKFSEQSNLKQHTLIHTGDKPYKCDECGVGFARLTNLNRHKRRHTD